MMFLVLVDILLPVNKPRVARSSRLPSKRKDVPRLDLLFPPLFPAPPPLSLDDDALISPLLLAVIVFEVTGAASAAAVVGADMKVVVPVVNKLEM